MLTQCKTGIAGLRALRHQALQKTDKHNVFLPQQALIHGKKSPFQALYMVIFYYHNKNTTIMETRP